MVNNYDCFGVIHKTHDETESTFKQLQFHLIRFLSMNEN